MDGSAISGFRCAEGYFFLGLRSFLKRWRFLESIHNGLWYYSLLYPWQRDGELIKLVRHYSATEAISRSHGSGHKFKWLYF